MATHCSTLAWTIPWMEESGRLQSMGSLRVRHNWVTSLSLFTFMHWRRKWQPTPVFLLGESQGWGSLVGCCLWGRNIIGHDWSDLAAAAAAWTLLSFLFFVVVQSVSLVWLIVTPWTAACQASLSFTVSRSLLKLISIELMMPSNHLILCHPLILLPSVFPSINVFFNELALCIRWPNYWSFSFNISPSSEYSGLISFRIDWFDLLAVQGILKNLSSTTVQKH